MPVSTPLILPTHHDVYPFISPHHALRNAAANRTILITGAGSGIGAATTETFTQAAASTIILVGRNVDKLQRIKDDLGPKYPACNFMAESCDISSAASVDDLFARLKEQDAEIDVLINNAGVAAEYGSIRDSDPEVWWRNHEIMLKGPYLMSRAFLRARSGTRGPGAILMTSTIGSWRLEEGMSSYCIPKTALNRLAEYLASETRDAGVQCIAFHPGGVAETELTAGAPEWLARLLTDTAELAGATALWLSLPRAAWLSGRYVDARWDMEELEELRGQVEGRDGLKGVLGGLEGYRDRKYGIGKEED